MLSHCVAHGRLCSHLPVFSALLLSLLNPHFLFPPSPLPFRCARGTSQGESLCREALTTAALHKNLDDLNLNLQKASEMGLSGPEVDRAKALQKELHISHASLKALRCVCARARL